MSPKHWLIDRNAKVSNFKEWKGLLKISVTLPLLLLLLLLLPLLLFLLLSLLLPLLLLLTLPLLLLLLLLLFSLCQQLLARGLDTVAVLP